MTRPNSRRDFGFVKANGVGVAALALCFSCALVPARGQQQGPTYQMSDFGVIPRPTLTQVLLASAAVQQELKITEAQKKELAAIEQRRMEKVRKARQNMQDRAKFQAEVTAIMDEAAKARHAILKPEQLERLGEIQLQAQGPFAFQLANVNSRRYVNPQISERLKMSPDQVKRAEAIANEGDPQITEAASFKIALDPKDKPGDDVIRKLAERAEFRAAKAKARAAAHQAWDAVIHRILEVLNNEQRASYRKFLGKPFDLAKLNVVKGQSETDSDIEEVKSALEPRGGGRGGGGGQRADPGFDARVACPMFPIWHPRVAVDEAHANFHTADGRYKPFADLMTNDGFVVSRNTEQLTSETLGRYDIVVSANASSAFSEIECAAIQAWVVAGGALFLITDHEPFGTPSKNLGERFGVLMNTSPTNDPSRIDRGPGGLLFTRDDLLILDHPITRGRVPTERVNRVKTFTGQALIGPVGSTPFLRFADTATYRSSDGPKSAKGWAQGIALRYGAGRVVVMGEAGELSAQIAGNEPFGMNVPGIDNRQMAVNIMRWLTGTLEPATTIAVVDSAPQPSIEYGVPQPYRPLRRVFAVLSPGQR
jgi:hypothetical protein